MKQKLLLPLLLLLLAVVGVQAQDTVTKTVTFDAFTDGAKWKVPFASAYSTTEQTATMYQGTDTGDGAPVYNILYTATRLDNGKLTLSGTNAEALQNTTQPGSITLPKFNAKVTNISFTTAGGSAASKIEIYDLNSDTPGTPVVSSTRLIDDTTLPVGSTVDIPISDSTTGSQYVIKAVGSKYVVLSKIVVTLSIEKAISPEMSFSWSKEKVQVGQKLPAQKLERAEGAQGLGLTYSSSNPNVVVVNATSGATTLTGNIGTAVISATSKGGTNRDGVLYAEETIKYTVISIFQNLINILEYVMPQVYRT